MDPSAFDSVVRSLSTSRSRRRLVATLAALPLAGGLAEFLADSVEAEKPLDRIKRRKTANRRKRRNKRNNNNSNNNNKGGGGKKLGDANCIRDVTNGELTDLQQIIDNASPFSSIVLCAGSFAAAGLRITRNVTLIGAGTIGQSITTLNGANPFGGGGTNTNGVFDIKSGTVLISNMIITGANGNVPAIGIEGGTVTLAKVGVLKNSGGGIVNVGGTLHLTEGTDVLENGSDAVGGGILHQGGTTTVASGCVIQGNTASDGGGIFDASGGTGGIQLGDSLIVRDNTPNNCSPVNTIPNCDN